MIKKYKLLQQKIKILIFELDKITKAHPIIVVIAMHELFRCLYYYDPYIKNKKKNHFKNLVNTVHNLAIFVDSAKNLGSYKNILLNKKYDTQILFGKLWKERSREKAIDSFGVLNELIRRAKLNKNLFKNKKILDLGCGSGRFTCAFAKLGAKVAVGVDLGNDGIKIGKLFAKKNKIKNVKFYKANILKLPFKKNSFDFIFCKGVLHHTGNLKKGLSEMKRVLKPGCSAFLYLYGGGGIFWNTRKLMRIVMKKIPLDYSIKVLNMIGMPARRTIFVDSWYVPVEEHVKKNYLENWLKINNFSFRKYKNGKKTELENIENTKYFYQMFGDGELRYIIKKN